MICSTIIPTFKRPKLLARAVNSVLEQLPDQDSLEVIVVNDAGKPLQKADWQESPLVTIINTNRCERSAARNAGAALAKGEWLHFLDDDDYVLPGAYDALLDVANTGDYVMVYGDYQIVNDVGEVTRLRAAVSGNIFAWLIAGEAIPHGAIWIRREVFYHVGCFDATLRVHEDGDLVLRAAAVGDVGCSRHLIQCMRTEYSTTTTDWSRSALEWRCVREKFLDSHVLFSRLRDASKGDTHLRGRVCRAYIASAAENARKAQCWKGVARFLTCARLAGLHIFTPDLWRGLLTTVEWQGRGQNRVPRDPSEDQGKT